ncbi:coiled-coil domain-containing protein 50-like [Bufo gargarizans]|uniref:coiled-coil domain-containing protein 50-like n=1 Tax=Bufo gargarizans TaxID=30331 RepID=UPI001CF28351|nr:coiled-coil domain-containing protein 50-like [Bufo gargarizans]XP_044134342.1 coiled-coil domain-containing protein 50-like [Bufo gargarizans]
MTDIPIDKSNLPRVNEVCRDFAVLEDGALAHCLQEQEIEQHYAFNVRKNKLVQKDIRIAKKLQDEEDQQSKVFSLEQQKQIEELDSEYARAVQEELQRKAQECLQREEQDKEIAKRLQQLEEEELQRNVQERTRGEHSSRQRQYLTSLDNEEEEGYPFRNDSSKHHNASDYRRGHRSSERDHSSKNPEDHPGRMIPNRVSFGQVYYDSNNSKNSKTPDVWKEPSRKDQQVQFSYRNPKSSSERSPCHPSSSEGTSSHERDMGRKEEKVRGHRDKHCRHHSDRCRRSSSDSDDCPEHCARDKRSRRSQWNQNHDLRHHRPSNKPSCRISSHVLSTGEETRPTYGIEPLDRKMAELHVQSSDQLVKDEELARRLQEEEEKRIAKLKRHDQNEDFRAAQVAQDEEIAKYIQQQELRAHRRSEELDLPGDSDDDGSVCSFTDRRSIGIKNDVPSSNQGPLDSEGLASPTECRTPEKMEFSALEGTLDQTKLCSPRNIAEELDPTFKKESQSEVFAVCPQEFPVSTLSTQTQPVPVDGFYDFMDDGTEPIFIPPTKRQPEKLGRSKPKDKKEGCKQQ